MYYISLAVFAMIWIPIVCIACMVAGFYVAFCKQERLNPLRNGLVLRTPEYKPDEEIVVTQKPGEIKGFYE